MMTLRPRSSDTSSFLRSRGSALARAFLRNRGATCADTSCPVLDPYESHPGNRYPKMSRPRTSFARPYGCDGRASTGAHNLRDGDTGGSCFSSFMIDDWCGCVMSYVGLVIFRWSLVPITVRITSCRNGPVTSGSERMCARWAVGGWVAL